MCQISSCFKVCGLEYSRSMLNVIMDALILLVYYLSYLEHKYSESMSIFCLFLLVMLTHFLCYQEGAVHAPPWGGKGTWESERAEERERTPLFDCQSRLSFSAGPKSRKGTR